ncbi:MAG: MtrB/PioB family outer membrane beta-barrel protein [Terriglobales bacterium]
MKLSNHAVVIALLIALLAPVAVAQDKDKEKDEKAFTGFVEFGVRGITGDEDGRPDLPFAPDPRTSKFNEYRDIRNGFFIRRLRVGSNSVFGSANYFNLQSDRTGYRDQTYLATFGRYNYYKIQFRFDEIPHTYSNTTRTVFGRTAPGVFTVDPTVRAGLQSLVGSAACLTGSTVCLLPSTINAFQSFVGAGNPLFFFRPEIIRRSFAVSASVDVTPSFNVSGYFWREHQLGLRPIGSTFSTPGGASLTAGFGAEIPETIDYNNNLIKATAEYGRGDWGVQAGYTGSFFRQNVPSITWDNPFLSVGNNCAAGGCTGATQGPLTGRMDTYPDNNAHYLNFAGAFDIAHNVRVMASVVPGWLRQNAAFLPYTTNTSFNSCGDTGAESCASTTSLPASSLGGQKQTLAMNYTVVAQPWKKFQIKAVYRQYDYNNNTPIREFTPVVADFSLTTPDENHAWGYNRKNMELTGNYFLGKKSTLKFGYVGEIMDREERDVAHSVENGAVASLDLQPHRDFTFRVSYKGSARRPEQYQDEEASNPGGIAVPCDAGFSSAPSTSPAPPSGLVLGGAGFTAEQVCHRRFDEAARNRNRIDASASYTYKDRLTISPFVTANHDNYNIPGGANALSPLNPGGPSSAAIVPTMATAPYYIYGLLEDSSYGWGIDADYGATSWASLFAEYSHETYRKKMVSRFRTSGALANCSAGCDTPNNDWDSTANDYVDIWTAGGDFNHGKKLFFTTYYSLAAGKGNVLSEPLGNITQTAAGLNKFLLIGTRAAVPYPETANRTHEVAAVVRYKITENIIPRFEYRYSQWDNRDYQTSPMTPYMGCISPATNTVPPAPPTNTLIGCPTPLLIPTTPGATGANDPNPAGSPYPFYPFFKVGDTGAARYLFLGADQPSYHMHYFAATLEIHF